MVRVPTHRTPTHPGEMLREEFLEPLDISQRELADAIGVRQPSLSARLKKDTAVPAEWAVAVHRDSGIPLSQIRPDLWPESA